MEKNKKRVLIVDDDGFRGPAFKDGLEAYGYGADCVKTSQEALKLIQNSKENNAYKFVFIDKSLGSESDMDGIEATKELTEKYPDLKVIVFTGNDQNRNIINEALVNGAYRYMFSPFELKEANEIMECADDVEELEKQLREDAKKELWLRCLLEDSALGISIVDRKYRLIYMNEQQREMSKNNDGSNKEICLGGVCWVEFYNGINQTHPCAWCPVKVCYNEGRPYSNITVTVKDKDKDGTLTYYELYATPIWNQERSKIIGAMKMVRDITHQEELVNKILSADDKKKRLEAMLDNIISLGYKRVRLYELTPDKEFMKGIVQKGARIKRMATKTEQPKINAEEIEYKGLENFESITIPLREYYYSEKISNSHTPLLEHPQSEGKKGIFQEELKIDTWIDVPIRYDGQFIGKISLDNGPNDQNPESLTEEHFNKLMVLAEYAGRVIMETNRKEQIQKEAEQLDKLREMDIELANTSDLNTCYETIVRYAKELTNALSLHLRHYENGKLIKKAGLGVYAEATKVERAMDHKTSGSAKAFLSKEPEIIRNAQEDEGFIDNIKRYQCKNSHRLNEVEKLKEIEAIGTFPLIADGKKDKKVVGVISLQSDKMDFFSPDMIKLINDFCRRAAALIYTNELLEEKEAALQKLKEADEEKTNLLNKVAHSLKLPLHTMDGFAQRLVRNKYSTEEERILDCEVIQRQIKHFKVSTDNMLNLVRGEENRIKPEHMKFDLLKLISETTKVFEPLAKAKGIRIIVYCQQEKLFIFADEHMTEEILHNMLSNAITYTKKDKNGEVCICVEQDYKNLTIKISDTGIGIPKEEQERVFDKQFRGAKAGVMSSTGSGIGLTVCKMLVEARGGSISLESEVGKGTCFTIVLPVQNEALACEEEKGEGNNE